MKKLFFVLICLSAAAGILMAETTPKAGLPLRDYSLKISEASLHQFSETATQISYIKAGDTLGSGSFDTLIYLGEDALEKQAKKGRLFPAVSSGLRSIGFEFPIEQDIFQKFGFSGSGYIYFGNDSVTPGVFDESAGDPFRCTGRNLFGIGIFRYSETYNMSNGRRTPAEVIVKEDTKIRYEKKDDTLYVGYENMHIRDIDGNLALTISYQLQIEKDGSVSVVFGNIDLKNEESVYYLEIGFTSSQVTQNVNFKKEILDRLGNNAIVQLSKEAAAEYSGKKYTMVPPPACEAFYDSEFNIDTNKVLSEPDKIRFENNFYDKEKVSELLMVLSESQAPIKDQLVDGTDYSIIGEVNGMPVVYGKNGSVFSVSSDSWKYFDELRPNTRYWLHVFPYNSDCAYGPVFGMELTYAVSTAMEPLESIAVDTVSEDGIRVKISGATNYLLGFSNRKIIDYRGNPASNMLQNGKKYQAGDTIHFIDTHTSEDYEADIHIVAVNQSDASYTLKNPKAGTDYYLYAWAMSEEDFVNYSSSYVETACRTVTEAPGTINFKGLEWETSPVGWEIEQGRESSTGPLKPKFVISTYDAWQEPVLAGEWFFQEKSSGTASMWAISPWFKGSGRLQAIFNGAFYKLKNDFLTGNTPVFQAAVNESDSIVFEVQERGDTAWQRIGLIDSRTSWTADFNDYITDFFTPEEEFRFRMTFYQDGKTAVRPESGRFYALRSLRVEAATSCLYPVNIMAPKDSMGYRTAKVMWTDPNERSNEISYVVRYRMAGESEWMIGGRPKTPEMVLEGLRPGTDYVAEVNTVCSAEESSSAREVTFTTARNVVYQEEIRGNLSEMEYQLMKGEAGELTELGSKDESWMVYTDMSAAGAPMVVGLYKSLAKVSDRWLLTPVLYSGFDGKVKMRVSMAAWLDESNERKAATGVENDTLHIYRAAERSFAQPETVGKVVIDDLTPEYRTLEFEFDVKALVPNIFGFYLGKVKDYGNESNNSSLAISEIELGYSEDNDFPTVSSLQVYNLDVRSFTIGWKGEAESYAVVSRKMSGEEYDTAYTEKNEYDFSGLEAGTRYGVQVLGYYGKNRTLAGPASKEQVVNTLEDPNSCGKPSSLMAEYTKGTDSAILRWITGRNNRSSIVHLKVNEAPAYDTVKVNVNYHTLLQLQPNAVYHWRVQGVCDTALSALSEESEFETEYETKAEREFAQGLNIRVNGKQIVVENASKHFIKSLKVYSPSGILLRTYRANTADNLFIQTDLRQGVVIIKAEGQGGESHAVKAVIM